MKQIKNFEDLRGLKCFVRFDKNTGEFNTYMFCCDEPNHVEGYMYFFNKWTMDVVRFHESIMNNYLFYEKDENEDFKLAMLQIKMDILNNKIKELKELYNKREKELEAKR